MSLSKGRRAALACGLGVSLLALMVPPLAATASAATPKVTKLRPITSQHVLYDVGVPHTVTQAEVAKAATSSGALATFTSKVTDPQNKKTYTYTMVGSNPEVKGSSNSTTIRTFIVPLKIVITGTSLSWDPTVKDSCDSGASAISRVQASPIFKSRAWTLDGTSVGTGEYMDAFQRANFWKYTGPSGSNSGFSINFAQTTLSKLTLSVPAKATLGASISCGNGEIAAIPLSTLESYIQNTAIPSLASMGVNASTVPIFETHNVVLYEGSASSPTCCVLGFHNAYQHSGLQTYAFDEYDNSKDFSNVSDVSSLSHEADELMDDPYVQNGGNPTAPWGHIGQVTGCQSNLEVGDPLSGTIFSVPSSGFTYHMQELAFFSWFFRQAPSIGLNGKYSDQGKFTTPAAACS